MPLSKASPSIIFLLHLPLIMFSRPCLFCGLIRVRERKERFLVMNAIESLSRVKGEAFATIRIDHSPSGSDDKINR